MNKTELIVKVAGITGQSKKEATPAVEAVFDAISDALANGEKVSIGGFGNFEVSERKAREGNNPALLNKLKEQGVDPETAKAQAKVQIPATIVPKFSAAKALKDLVKQ